MSSAKKPLLLAFLAIIFLLDDTFPCHAFAGGDFLFQTCNGSAPSAALCAASAFARSSFSESQVSMASLRMRCMPPTLTIAGVLPWSFSLCQVLRLIPTACQTSATVRTPHVWVLMCIHLIAALLMCKYIRNYVFPQYCSALWWICFFFF